MELERKKKFSLLLRKNKKDMHLFRVRLGDHKTTLTQQKQQQHIIFLLKLFPVMSEIYLKTYYFYIKTFPCHFRNIFKNILFLY